jgi:hypothetical protein
LLNSPKGREREAALVRAPPLTLIATIPVAMRRAEVGDEGRVCMIANTPSDDLSFICIAGAAEIVRVPIGNGPKHITVARIPLAVVAGLRTPR